MTIIANLGGAIWTDPKGPRRDAVALFWTAFYGQWKRGQAAVTPTTFSDITWVYFQEDGLRARNMTDFGLSKFDERTDERSLSAVIFEIKINERRLE
jgi:hypothetical protein